MLKRLAALIACLLLLLTGCRQEKKLPLPEGMDTETVIAEGIDVATRLGEGDYRSIFEQLREDVAASLQIEDVAALNPHLGNWQGVTASSARGMEDKASGEYYAMVTMVCQFEEGKRVVRVGFDQEGILIGLSVAEP